MAAGEETNVVALHGAESLPVPQKNEQVEALVRQMAEAFERGEVAALAFVWVDPTGRVSSDWACPAAANLLTAGVARLQHRLQTKLDDG